MAQAALRLQGVHELLERQVLMGLRAERGLAGLGHQLRERGAAVQRGAQHLRVDEEADEARGLGAVAVGDRHAHAHIGLARVAMQQRLEAREQHHEQRGAVRLRGGVQAGDEGRVEVEGMRGRAVVGDRVAGTVRGQGQHGMVVAELGAPVGQLAFGLAGGEPVALPRGVVGVLDRRCGERRRLALRVRRIGHAELVEQHLQRGAVGHDVVRDDREDVVRVAELEPGGAQHGAGHEVEGLGLQRARLCGGGAFTVAVRQRAQVDVGERQRRRRQHLLADRAVGRGAEHGAQAFVAREQAFERRLHCVGIQHARQAQRHAHVVGAVLRIELPEEPLARLRMRQREQPRAALGRQGRDRPVRAALAKRPHAPQFAREVAQARLFEQRAQRKVDVPALADARGHLRGGERVAAVGEEVRVARQRPFGGAAQHLVPDRGEGLFDVVECGFGCVDCRGASAQHERTVRVDRIGVRRAIDPALAAGAALQLAARGLGHAAGVEQHHDRQRLAALLAHGRAQCLDQHLGPHQLLDAARHLGREADALAFRPLDREGRDAALAHGLDLALHFALDVLRVQVVAAHDDHVLDAAGHVELAVVHEAQVAGAQPARAVVLDEGLLRHLGLVPVAAAQARARGPDFADGAIGAHAQRGGVDDAHRVVRDAAAAAHEHRAAVVAHHGALRQARLVEGVRDHAGAAVSAGDEQRRFGQAVAGVDRFGRKARGREALLERPQRVGAHRLGAGEREAP
ncbi:hypothetical protein D3C86_947430 [compost metagenome]